jgi:hypothetical protein
MPPAQLNVDTLVATFKDARVIEALTQALVPCLQTIIKPIVDSVYAEMKQEIDDQRNVIGSLECENIELRRRVQDLEAYSRIDNLVIHGLPEQYAESAATTSSVESDSNVSSEQQFIKFCESKLHVTVKESDISIAHRLPRKPGSRPTGPSAPRALIVRFTNRRIRSRILAAKKLLRGDSTSKIYVNEHLSEFASKVFAATRRLYNNKKIAGTWTYNGQVYLRKHGLNEKAVLITSLDQLQGLD